MQGGCEGGSRATIEMDESGNGKRGCPVFPASGAIILPNTRSQCSVEMKVPGFSNGGDELCLRCARRNVVLCIVTTRVMPPL